ncbi:bifunctional hydroxymethylpyrimidine kinase/phosphomethylpyrimidine kinase [Lactobacillus sp. ESL0791]|uniref:bifunctional hydroxymethylpyrimidine kinase/phosphomethylpyrimidine kinase n=1 Tax=Lactobacillus sp. ESL0791 TaxID=2983234 RepID=UPI0023F9B212|nr:bifunctional hydroxymethylpyrimidine kinase/phosphomethylpyrimidine kinase [Lactobacillus sp. ESL0791]MDF7638015.1 bifunctional hydroxymethylpyrimidine kinase/phosphomethylpyrimidine kinase [Lactobacillus sp. ESL0791]
MTEEINSFPQVLTIAGTDSGGGAGIMADLKTFQMQHVFGTAVVVAVTAQNTLGVQASYLLPLKMIDQQCSSLAADFHIRACKTGMLGDAAHVHQVALNLQKYDFGFTTIDPVMVAKGGAPLLSEDAVTVVKKELLPLADLVTPNLPEAEKLTGQKVTKQEQYPDLAAQLQNYGVKNVMIKGGHFPDEQAKDYILLEDGNSFWVSSPRTHTKRTHGTGDTLASCITAQIALGKDLPTAIKLAKKYVTATIKDTIQVGHGHGPLNHWAKAR